MMEWAKLINLAAQSKMGRMAARFPVSVMLWVSLAAAVFVESAASSARVIAPGPLSAIFLGGAVLSLAAVLWLESRLSGIKLHAASALPALLWGAYCMLGQYPAGNDMFLKGGLLEALAVIAPLNEDVMNGFFAFSMLEAVMLAAGAALLIFIPFLGKGKEAAFGNFFSRIFTHVALACAIGIVFKTVFKVVFYNVVYDNYGTSLNGGEETGPYLLACVLCFVLFLPLWVMAHIPKKEAMRENAAALNSFQRAAGMHLRWGIAVYVIIIYAFYICSAASEVWMWGNIYIGPWHIAVPVSILAAAGLLNIMLLYPTRLRSEGTYGEDDFEPDFEEEFDAKEERVRWRPPQHLSCTIASQSRWFGVVMLPLLILMSGTIYVRVFEYGLTITRAYLILLNLWFYGIFAYLFFTNGRGVKWIPISLGALLIASSVGPWSVSNITKQILVSDKTKNADYLLSAYGLDDSYAATWEERDDKPNADSTGYTVGDYTVKPSGKRNCLTITGYTGSDTALSIPARLDGKKVDKIGEDAFANKGLVRVTIPRGVTAIRDRAFMQNKLTGVTIPNRVTVIGVEAFLDNELASATIPKSVTAIGDRAFAYNGLTSVTIPGKVNHIGQEAFARNRLASVTVPGGVTIVRYGTFADNELTRVAIKNGVTAISYEAFAGNRLTSVTFPKSVRKVAPNAFAENGREIVWP